MLSVQVSSGDTGADLQVSMSYTPLAMEQDRNSSLLAIIVCYTLISCAQTTAYADSLSIKRLNSE